MSDGPDGLPNKQPELATPRLLLRAFLPDDAAEVQRMAGDAEVAELAVAIPHPYPDGAAEQWIATHESGYRAATEITYAITRRDDARLLGTVSLMGISARHARAELGYWVGREHWGCGYCNEAAARLIEWAFHSLGLTRIVARCVAHNAASARVLLKIGMQPEGRLALHTAGRGGGYEDTLLFGLNRPERRRISSDTAASPAPKLAQVAGSGTAVIR